MVRQGKGLGEPGEFMIHTRQRNVQGFASHLATVLRLGYDETMVLFHCGLKVSGFSRSYPQKTAYSSRLMRKSHEIWP